MDCITVNFTFESEVKFHEVDVMDDFNPVWKEQARYRKFVRDNLTKLNIQFKESYCWPDGSLYFDLITRRSVVKLKTMLNKRFLKHGITPVVHIPSVNCVA